jgi:hypothetical protein
MIYSSLKLQTVAIILGIALVVLHAFALMSASLVKHWLKSFPRSRTMGITLLTMVSLWAFWLAATMDLGEFSTYRGMLKLVIPLAWFLSLQFVDEFLSVRALGILLLLLAEPVLEATFLNPQSSRLLLVVLAYAWAVAGLFWVGMPYLLRDQIAWWSKTDLRWRSACFAGIAYGAAILIFAGF